MFFSLYFCRYVNKEREIPGQNGLTFIRKGQTGDWKTHFSTEMSARWDAKISSQILGSGLENLIFH